MGLQRRFAGLQEASRLLSCGVQLLGRLLSYGVQLRGRLGLGVLDLGGVRRFHLLGRTQVRR